VEFVPNGIERSLGRRTWAADLADITDATIAERAVWPLSALRRRLVLRADAGDAYFFVPAVDDVVSTISTAIASA
jgi:hypothetical protein